MRNFCLFIALVLLFYPLKNPDILDYFGEAEVEFCTCEQPPEDADAVSNGVFWEVRTTSGEARKVLERLSEVKAVAVTVQEFDRKRFFRDFRVTVLSKQELPDLTVWYVRAGGEDMQIAERDGLVKIGIPALLGSY